MTKDMYISFIISLLCLVNNLQATVGKLLKTVSKDNSKDHSN